MIFLPTRSTTSLRCTKRLDTELYTDLEELTTHSLKVLLLSPPEKLQLRHLPVISHSLRHIRLNSLKSQHTSLSHQLQHNIPFRLRRLRLELLRWVKDSLRHSRYLPQDQHNPTTLNLESLSRELHLENLLLKLSHRLQLLFITKIGQSEEHLEMP